MRYSRSVKVSILKRVLPPENRSIRSVSQETGISEQTIRNWIGASKDVNLTEAGDEKSPRFYTSQEKYLLLMEASRLSDEATPDAIEDIQKAVKKAVTENMESKYQGLYEILDGAKNDSAIIINFEEERMGQRKFAKALKECATIAVETVKSYKK